MSVLVFRKSGLTIHQSCYDCAESRPISISDRAMALDWNRGDLCEGRRCFNSGDFFEAHEHWESVWLAAPELEKTFLQALIQVAASFHHWQRNNYEGTTSLLRSALRRLDLYPGAYAGVAVAPLRAAIRMWLQALEASPRSPFPVIPRLELTTTPSPSATTEWRDARESR